MSAGQITVGGVVYDVELTPHTAPVPTPVPTPTPPPAPAPAGTRIRMLWRFGWSNLPLSSYPVDVLSSLTAVSAGMAQSARSGTGQLLPPPGLTPAQVDQLAAAGVDVYVTVAGGVPDGGVTLLSDSNVIEMLASLRAIRSSLHVRHVDLDLETDPGSSWTPGAVINLAQALVADGCKVGITTALWGGRAEAWGQVARALGAALHHWCVMAYDYPEATDSRQTGVVLGKVATMLSYTTAGQVVVGLMQPSRDDQMGSPPAVARAAYAAVRAAHPEVGWAVWADSIEAGAGWTLVRTLAQV